MRNKTEVAMQPARDYVDNRRHLRFMFEINLHIRSPRLGIIPGRSLELSESGFSALVPAELLLEEIVDMELQLPFGPVLTRAMVRNRNVFRYGFEFLNPSAVQQELKDKLARLVARTTVCPKPTPQ
ncbi:MAG: PilZ protein [Acidobacteriaceae bacterium]|nr:PilZ protein [Acidobacteriaceae bacterium]